MAGSVAVGRILAVHMHGAFSHRGSNMYLWQQGLLKHRFILLVKATNLSAILKVIVDPTRSSEDSNLATK